VLRGEAEVRMREEVVVRAARSGRAVRGVAGVGAGSGSGAGSGAKRSAAAAELTSEQAEVFERLRVWRAEEAKRQGVPGYVVFGDATLAALAVHAPSDDAGLLSISGIGEVKLERYGAAVLAELQG
jgi:ATP-dependent DNA helicase RecQ